MTTTRRFGLVACLVALLIALTPTPAAAQATGATTTPLGPDELLALFDAQYTPPSSYLDDEWALQALNHASSNPMSPSLTFTQRAALNNFQNWTLNISLSGTVPLYRGRAQSLGLLREQQAEHLALSERLAYQEARLDFLRDTMALSRLRHLTDLVNQVLSSLSATEWQPPQGVAESFEIPPALRDSLAAYNRVVGLQEYLETTLPTLEQRIAAKTGLAAPVGLEPFSDLAQRLVPAPPTVQQCLHSSPMLADVRHAHAVQFLEREVQRAPDIRVDLTGSSTYSSGALTATLGLEARVPLPSGWPVSGYVGAAAGMQGADQTVRITWPATPPSPGRPVPHAELAERQQAQLQAVERELTSLLQSLDTSARMQQAAETQLLWAVADLFSAPNLAAAHHQVGRLTGDPQSDLHLVLLHSDLAFAQISHADSLLTASAACGTGL